MVRLCPVARLFAAAGAGSVTRRQSSSGRALQLSWPSSKPGFNDGLVWQPFSGETTLEKLKLPKAATNTFAAGFTLAACVMLAQGDAAVAASKSQRCETYAHNAAR